jgi:type I restriction enzyme S subunit
MKHVNQSANTGAALPKGWAYAQIKDICNLINGRAFKPTEWSSKGLPIVRIQNLNDINTNFNYCDFPVDEKFVIDNGQLLFAWSGTPETSFGAHIWNRGKAALNQHIFRVEVREDCLVKSFIMYLFNNNVTEYIRKAHGTAGLAHITKGHFENSVIPIPPFNEQQRIVAKLEELFTKLDAGIKSLQTVDVQLKRYRQSVLKSAFDGKLTEKWRHSHRNELEPASKLLEHIKEERTSTTGTHKEHSPLDTSNLQELPEGWVWTSIGDIAESMKNGIYKPRQFYGEGGTACLRMYNIEDGSIVWKNIKRMNLSPEEIQEYELRWGDILVNRVNSRELVGKAAAIPEGMELSVFESKNIRLRLRKDYVVPNFVSSWFRVFRQRYFNQHAQQVVGMASINQDQVGSMPIPLASFQEQQRIADEIEYHFSIAEDVEKVVINSSRQAEKLRQSVLKRAFEGKLVPQDLSDEPASVLLKKIRSLKAQTTQAQNLKREKQHDSKQRRLI